MKIAYKNETLSLAATGSTAAMKVDWAHGFSVQATWTGTLPVGDFTIEGSNDAFIPDNVGNSLFETSSATWTTVTGSTFAAGGAAGSSFRNVSDVEYAAFRVKYTRTSGTGTATFVFLGKGQI